MLLYYRLRLQHVTILKRPFGSAGWNSQLFSQYRRDMHCYILSFISGVAPPCLFFLLTHFHTRLRLLFTLLLRLLQYAPSASRRSSAISILSFFICMYVAASVVWQCLRYKRSLLLRNKFPLKCGLIPTELYRRSTGIRTVCSMWTGLGIYAVTKGTHLDGDAGMLQECTRAGIGWSWFIHFSSLHLVQPSLSSRHLADMTGDGRKVLVSGNSFVLSTFHMVSTWEDMKLRNSWNSEK